MIGSRNLNSFIGFIFIFDIEILIRDGGLFTVWLIVYASTGLFFCFFLPVGAVLFGAGVLAAASGLPYNIITICGVLISASIMGNLTGYLFGRAAGPSLYRRKDTRFFKQQYLKAAGLFYKKYGLVAFTVGLYLPIIRTFAPIVAGITDLKLRRFMLLIVCGSVLWISSFVLTGYFLGSRPILKPWLKYIVIGFILIVTIPLLVKIIKEFRKPRN